MRRFSCWGLQVSLQLLLEALLGPVHCRHLLLLLLLQWSRLLRCWLLRLQCMPAIVLYPLALLLLRMLQLLLGI
jgi:hypothetical protein